MIKVATTLEISGGILVGHDGSPAAAEAVRWAARLAGGLGTQLHVARCWSISTAPRPSSATAGYVPPLTDFEAAVLERLRADIAELDLPTGVVASCHVLHGPPGRRLLEASERADMLVIGSRGAGGFLGLHLGSTADQAVRHARCPVVVVPVEGTDHPQDLDVQLAE
jgi:nucleotide-binding universal stress UspA family protein